MKISRILRKSVLISALFLPNLSNFCSAEVNEAEIKTQIRELASPSVPLRNAAEQNLLKMGPEILPFLPETARQPEVKLRLNRIRLQLERTSAELSLDASRISLPESINAQELKNQTYLKTRNIIDFSNPSKTDFTFEPSDTETAPTFWEFLDQFCDEYHFAPQVLQNPKGILLATSVRTTPRAASKNPRVAYLGPFRLEPQKITSTLLLESNTPALLLQLEIAWEPRIQPVFAYLKLTEIAFENDSQTSPYTSLQTAEHEILIGVHDFRSLCDAALPATKIPADAQTISLRGTFSVVACGTSRDFIFDDLATKIDQDFTPVSERTAAVLVTLTGLRTEKVLNSSENESEIKEPQNYLVATLRYRYEESREAMESHRMWIYENDAFLEAPDGSRIVSARSEMLRQTPNEIAVDIYFPLTPESEKSLSSRKLIFPRPCGIYEVEYPFEIKEIPVP